MMKVSDWLKTYGKNACHGAKDWLISMGQSATMAQAWADCKRPDWMLWALNASNSRPADTILRRLACAYVRRTPLADGRTVWDLLTDERSRNAVEVAERHADGNATDEELAAARDAAGAAAWAAAGDAAGAAAGAAAWDAAWDSAGDAAWDAAGDAAWAAAGAAAGDAALDAAGDAQCAIIREFIKCPWGEQ